MTKVVIVDKWPDDDGWARAKKEWEAMPKEEREAWIKAHAAAIDRWQAETDAMCGLLEDEEEV